MLDASAIAAGLRAFTPEQLRSAVAGLLPESAPAEDRVRAIAAALRSPAGQSLRDAMANWIVDTVVPVEKLVPEAYLKWRPPVRDAMMFVVARLSPARLAPKLLEQLQLPANTPPETRLLRLIAKVPGLQKLGQVIARNRHLRPALRSALARLENGIRDVKPQDVRAIIRKELGSRLETFSVRLAPRLLSEASVSAVVRFTWLNPATGRRERGVFKVLKPHIPGFFAEDMDYLQGLAQYFGDRHLTYGFPRHLIPDTFRKVRRLLQHEVNFRREQKTLVHAWSLYQSRPGVRIPRVIPPLCAPTITALTEERGVKVTRAAARLPAPRRRRIAEQIIEALIAVPLLSPEEDAIFHGDPHAGNLLYDNRSGELTIIDWALREHLSREQRRHLAVLFLSVSLRDSVTASDEILALSQQRIRGRSPRARLVRDTVNRFLDELPVTALPSGADAMRLLERVALQGVRFPASLVMLSKVMVTLEGILGDIAGPNTSMGLAIARHVARQWLSHRDAFRSPLAARDWIMLQCSALLYPGRLWLQCQHAILNRIRPPAPSPAST